MLILWSLLKNPIFRIFYEKPMYKRGLPKKRGLDNLRGELVEKMAGFPMGMSNLWTHLSYLTQFPSPAIFIINRFFKKFYLDLNVEY